MEKLHPIEFPIVEKRLLRAVVKAIEETERMYPGVTPNAVMSKYYDVKKFYEEQMADEEYLITTFHPEAPEEVFD